MRAAVAQFLDTIGPVGTHALVFGIALLLAYGFQPLPFGGGIRGASWWRAFRAIFRRRRRYRDGGFTGPPIPLHPNCRCVLEPIARPGEPVPPLPDAFLDWPGKAEGQPKPPILWVGDNPEDAMNDTTKPRTYAPSKPADQAPAIELTPVESSQLAAFGWDADSKTLAIRFHGKDGKPGGLYHYANFGETDYAALRDAASKGSHFLRAIKPHVGRYPCCRIIETQAD